VFLRLTNTEQLVVKERQKIDMLMWFKTLHTATGRRKTRQTTWNKCQYSIGMEFSYNVKPKSRF